jgi:hypothetical protein
MWPFSREPRGEEPENFPQPVQAVVTPHIWWYEKPGNDAECAEDQQWSWW